MKIAISIPDPIYRTADTLARRLGLSRSELYANAVSEYLAKYATDDVTARLDAVYAEEDSSADPRLIELQRRSLPEEEW